MFLYDSVRELTEAVAKSGRSLSELVIEDQAEAMELSTDEVYRKMEERFDVMVEAVHSGNDKNLRSTSGLTGGEGYKLNKYSQENGGIMGEFMTKAIGRALSVSGLNAAMGKIVATPTAGSCGIMPGCFVSLYEDRGFSKEAIVKSMFTASAIGMVIAKRANVAGAEGGCQAECGSAAAMVAAAMTELYGGNAEMSAHAAAIAISNQLGLVCDPVAGLVEIPCIKRNAQGVVTAMAAADMALAGLKSEIPCDEVIDAMKSVGDMLPCALKETAGGGLATTPTGIRLKEQIFGKD
ncbi:MAG: L-serine ammonia-lyase, iron-sulfur-dependent, subunit alpha [Eubacteriales bacterium]|nr:L-serine ammonia-lyase, iron-sulfur-dependent, subunit alpha [Eubacteriales bacterium]